MAQKARKDRAKSNATALLNLHIGSAVVNLLFVLFYLIFRSRSIVVYVVLTIPSLICEYILETTGRPKYDAANGSLKSSGEDLGAAGLTEYMFDVIWITWASAVAAILFGNWGWILWTAIPAFGAYKGYSLLGAARGMAGGLQQQQGSETAAPAMNRKQRRAA